MDEKTIKTLIKETIAILPKSYAPYSHFHVAAALLGADGKIYTGVNIENASYGLCNCAERTAIFGAVAAGARDFTAICIMGTPEEGLPGVEKGDPLPDYCPPCGACRQVMSEFCGNDFQIILAKSTEDYEIHTMGELFPLSFNSENL